MASLEFKKGGNSEKSFEKRNQFINCHNNAYEHTSNGGIGRRGKCWK